MSPTGHRHGLEETAKLDPRRTFRSHSPFTRPGLTSPVSIAEDSPALRLQPSEPAWDRPAGLGIHERRSWATWQLAVVAVVAVFVGMIIGYSGKKTGPGGSTGAGIKLNLGPAPTSPRASTIGGSAGLSPGTQPTEPTTTGPTSTPSTSPASNTPRVVLMAQVTGSGPSQLPAFTTAGPWNIGWAYDCVGAPGGTAAFAIQVLSDVGTGASAVQESGRSGKGVSPENTSGRHRLQITTDPACRWAAKVTGIPG